MTCRSRTRIAVGILGGGLLLAGASTRRAISRWKNNPDPLDGTATRFPAGDAARVATDDGAEIHTVTAGVGPRIVLVHGLTSNIDDLGPIAELLIADGFSVTGLDQRGHGDSSVGADGFGASRQAADLAIVLNELGIDDAVVAGHSMGGMTSLTLAIDGPADALRRISGLVAIAAPSALASGIEQTIARCGVLPMPTWMTSRPSRLRVGARLMAFGASPSLFMIDESLASFLRCPEATRLGAMLGLAGYDVTDRLARIDLPVLVIAGGSDKMVSMANSGAVATRTPDARLIDYPTAGHMLIWERHQELATEIASFARSVQSTS